MVAGVRISDLNELPGASIVADDWMVAVDMSTGETKKVNPLEIKDVPSLGLQPADADLTTLSTAFTSASASGPASLAFAEDTDNGTNKVTVSAAASLAADYTVTLPSATGTLALTTAASDTVSGIVELAIASELNTGTDATRAVTPDALAGSNLGIKEVTVEVFAAATALATGDGKKYFRIPDSLNGMNLVNLGAGVFAKSTSGNPTVMIARGRQSGATSAHTFADMLSTALTIDANDYDSKDAGTPAAINTSNDDVATGDLIRFDVDTAGTAATGLFVTLGFQLP